MFLYFACFLLCFVSVFVKQAQNKAWLMVLLTFLCLFLCFGYMTGSDWRVYEEMYDEIDFNNLFYDYYSEPGFYIYMLPFRALGIDFFNFLVFTKTVCFAAIFFTLTRLAQEYKYVALMYYIPWYAFYLFVDNPLRNLIAISIITVSLPLLFKRRMLPFIGVVLLATTIHASAIIILPLCFVLKRDVPVWLYVVLFVAFNVVFANRSFVLLVCSKLFGGIPYVAAKIRSYLELNNEFAKGRIFSLGMIVHTCYFILLMYYRRLFDNVRHGMFVFNGAVIYLLLYRLSTTIEIFMRFQLYMAVFFVVALGVLIKAFTKSSRVVYVTALLCLCFVSSGALFRSSRYIPYTNYLVYAIRGDFPSYSYRSAYNPNNSPYRHNDSADK